MCGIAGFCGFSNEACISRDQIISMTHSMGHRGPDDYGFVMIDLKKQRAEAFKDFNDKNSLNYGNVALGHRRLSIIDLSAKGHQPMKDADGLVWLSYNGEIYNYVELRKTLEERGYRFRSNSDTEVILKSYLQWGTECFKKFNGMWGVAIYDLRTGRLILSRDRFGKKPLFYHKDKQGILFASEIKALLKHPRVEKSINLRKIINYAGRHYRYVDNDEETFFKDIYQVPKSCTMIVDKTGETSVQQYWTLQAAEPFDVKCSEAYLMERFKELLGDAVRIRLRSDVPLGVMMSGGLDSTSITCMAAAQTKDLLVFSGVAGKGSYDESEYVNEIIRHTGVKYKFIYPKPAPLMTTLREMMMYHDEPICTVTWYNLYLMTKHVAENGITVVLTGHGGDELLAGYWDHYHYHFSDLRSYGIDDTIERRAWLENHGRDPEEYNRKKNYIERLRDDKDLEREQYSQYLSCLSSDIIRYDRAVDVTSPFNTGLTKRLYSELLYETIPASLRAEDRNMMANSIENRVPFLDYRVVEFCFQLRNEYKIRNGLGKWILRESMKGVLPEKVRLRKEKVGFNAPAETWFREELRPAIDDMITSASPVNEIVYDRKAVKRYFGEHLSGANHAMFFWQYINMHVWYETVFGAKT